MVSNIRFTDSCLLAVFLAWGCEKRTITENTVSFLPLCMMVLEHSLVVESSSVPFSLSLFFFPPPPLPPSSLPLLLHHLVHSLARTLWVHHVCFILEYVTGFLSTLEAVTVSL